MFGKEGFDINKAARMVRAGNAFSETNRKLRDAVICFVEWLFAQVAEYQLPVSEEIGWHLKRLDTGFIELSFKTRIGGWHSVTTNQRTEQMNSIILLCQAIAGPEGKRLASCPKGNGWRLGWSNGSRSGNRCSLPSRQRC